MELEPGSQEARPEPVVGILSPAAAHLRRTSSDMNGTGPQLLPDRGNSVATAGAAAAAHLVAPPLLLPAPACTITEGPMSLKTGDQYETMEPAAVRSWQHPARKSRYMPCHAACCTDSQQRAVWPTVLDTQSAIPLFGLAYTVRTTQYYSGWCIVRFLWVSAKHSGVPALVVLASPFEGHSK